MKLVFAAGAFLWILGGAVAGIGCGTGELAEPLRTFRGRVENVELRPDPGTGDLLVIVTVEYDPGETGAYRQQLTRALLASSREGMLARRVGNEVCIIPQAVGMPLMERCRD